MRSPLRGLRLATIHLRGNALSLSAYFLLLPSPAACLDADQGTPVVGYLANRKLDAVRDIAGKVCSRHISISKMHKPCKPVIPYFASRLTSFAFAFDHGRWHDPLRAASTGPWKYISDARRHGRKKPTVVQTPCRKRHRHKAFLECGNEHVE